LKSFFKDDKCTISPTKDINGRYLGLNMNIPEIKKLEMGYVPSVESRLKLYDGEIDLNNTTWAGTGSGCSTVLRSQKIFNQGKGLQELISTFSDQGLNLLRRLAKQNRVELMNYILQDTPENNRVSILGVDMSDAVISDVKEFLLLMVNTEPAKVERYTKVRLSLLSLCLYAMKKNVITNRNGVFTFGDTVRS
jgi:predicted nucleotide-binding protein (sugar kinase/HSP70/actin superfamily)